mmetsp:Transcript_37625/g.42097  ORF Transcript_37625/g.42097 Transcript_37625/m.42097 type:complete len:82 (-) Transcript_37625:257-502(-)
MMNDPSQDLPAVRHLKVKGKRGLLREGVSGKVGMKDPDHRPRLSRKRIRIAGSTKGLLAAAEGAKVILKMIVIVVGRNLNS